MDIELSEESLEDFSGDDSQDEFILPTSEESDDGVTFLPSKKRKRFKETRHNARKKLFTADKNVNRPTADENANLTSDVTPEIQPEVHEASETVLDTPKKKPRKVIANPLKWKCNIRKQKHQAGESYHSRRGKEVPTKTVKNFKNCFKCLFKCSSKISKSERTELLKSYYSLSSTEKRHFLLATSERTLTARPKRTLNDQSSKRMYSFKYFFNVKGEKLQVCKSFYLGTLDHSQKPVYNAHRSKNLETNTPQSDKRGTSVSSRRTPTGDVDFAYNHIKSFPKVESHYCRAKTDREYLGSDLSVLKMYDLYLEKCKDNNAILPVKQSMYRHIFLTQFNLGFHHPKSDRCDVCEKYKMATKTGTMTEDFSSEYNHHIDEKTAMREESKRDKERPTPVLVFDLENVITCPRAQISSFFYTRKLSIYNLTAHLSTTNQVYCAIWNETMAGRAGNNIASALRRILDVVADENDITSLVTWSDSCVPQNRNSIMSCAIMDFLKENSQVKEITMKYSVPGHSCCQVVDSAHSIIERTLNNSEFYSPVGLIRLLKGANRKQPFRIIQMKESDFKDYASVAKLMHYKTVPFSKVACLKITQTYHEVLFKTSHITFEPMNLSNLKFKEKQAKRACKNQKTSPKDTSSVFDIKPKVELKREEISDLKKKDIQAMFPFMPIQDREYFKALLKIK